MAELDAIGLVVSDLARSVAFYRRVGLEFPEEIDESHGHVEAPLRGGLRFMLDSVETVRSFDPEWQEPAGGQRLGVAFLCDSAADVDRLFGELVEAGGRPHKEPWDAFWGQRYAQVADPDGTILDLFAPL